MTHVLRFISFTDSARIVFLNFSSSHCLNVVDCAPHLTAEKKTLWKWWNTCIGDIVDAILIIKSSLILLSCRAKATVVKFFSAVMPLDLMFLSPSMSWTADSLALESYGFNLYFLLCHRPGLEQTLGDSLVFSATSQVFLDSSRRWLSPADSYGFLLAFLLREKFLSVNLCVVIEVQKQQRERLLDSTLL